MSHVSFPYLPIIAPALTQNLAIFVEQILSTGSNKKGILFKENVQVTT